METFAGIITKKNINLKHEMKRMLTSMCLPNPLEEKPMIAQDNTIIGTSSGEFFSNVTQSMYMGLHGEIFNLEELKQKLKDAGQIVQSDKMRDLLMTSFQTWGTQCFKYFAGPFVIIVYDMKQKKITIARDRLGGNTLFWGKVNNTFLFACRLKGILSTGLVPQAPDLSAIASYFFLGYFPQDKTPIRNINRLLPGYYIEITQDQDLVINKYWSFKSLDADVSNYSQEQVNEQLHHLMNEAVKKRVAANKNIGCLMTDDIGSTALGYFLKRNSSENIKSFSVNFENTLHKDARRAHDDAKHFGFDHSTCAVTPDTLLDNLQHIVWHLDEPVADPNAAAIWKIGSMAKEKSCSIFAGLGSYEFLGSQMGHGNIAYEPIYLWFLHMSKPLFFKGAIPLLSKFSKTLSFHSLRFFQTDFWALEYIKRQALFSQKSFKHIAPSLHGLFDINLFLQQSYQYLKFILYKNFKVQDYLFFDAETSLSNCLLVQYERLFNAQGVSFYSPYFDHDVMQFLFSVPEGLKFKGKQAAVPLHMILQDEFKGEQLMGFPTQNPWFLTQWLNNPKLKNIFQMLTKGVLVEANIIDGKNLQKALDNKIWKYHQFERLWSILILEIWFRLFVNNPIYSYPEENQSLEDFMKLQEPFLIY